MQTRPLALQTQATRAFPKESAQARSLSPEGCISAPALPLPPGCFSHTSWSSPSAWGPGGAHELPLFKDNLANPPFIVQLVAPLRPSPRTSHLMDSDTENSALW